MLMTVSILFDWLACIVHIVLLQFSNIQVTRRYKHFDWLHQRLAVKFSTIAVPPLPGKQIAGLYHKLWPPCIADADIIFSSSGVFFFLLFFLA